MARFFGLYRQRHSNRRAYGQLEVWADCNRLEQRLTNPASHQCSALGICPQQQHDELVTAEPDRGWVARIGPPHDVTPGAGYLDNAPRNLAQHEVACFVPVLVVDFLEAVEINGH